MNAGENILSLRKEKKMSRRILSELSGVSESAIKQYETNKRQPKVEQLQRIADAFNVNVGVLLYGYDSTLIDSDGVRYSGKYIPQEEIDNDDLFEYRTVHPLTPVFERIKDGSASIGDVLSFGKYFKEYIPKSSQEESAIKELETVLEWYYSQPRMKKLFDLTKDASPEDFNKALKVLEAMLSKDGDTNAET